jgi:adenylate cyclase
MSTGASGTCVLLGEISGGSKLTDKLGQAEGHRAVERGLRRMERAAAAFKGRVIAAQGDTLTAVFDSAEAACLAATEMQQRIVALPPVSGVALTIRVGFHAGPVVEQGGQLSGDAVDTASRLLRLADVGQTLTTAEAVLALPKALRDQTRAIDLTVPGQDEAVGVHEVVWNHAADETPTTRPFIPGPAVPHAPVEKRLRLRLDDQELILGHERPTATLGRDAHADIVTMDSRASRAHGRIEYRRDKFVLIDKSTNGTYVTFIGEPELVLKREEAILRGRGIVCFGHSLSEAPADQLEFEILA